MLDVNWDWTVVAGDYEQLPHDDVIGTYVPPEERLYVEYPKYPSRRFILGRAPVGRQDTPLVKNRPLPMGKVPGCEHHVCSCWCLLGANVSN